MDSMRSAAATDIGIYLKKYIGNLISLTCLFNCSITIFVPAATKGSFSASSLE